MVYEVEAPQAQVTKRLPRPLFFSSSSLGETKMHIFKRTYSHPRKALYQGLFPGFPMAHSQNGERRERVEYRARQRRQVIFFQVPVREYIKTESQATPPLFPVPRSYTHSALSKVSWSNMASGSDVKSLLSSHLYMYTSKCILTLPLSSFQSNFNFLAHSGSILTGP